MPDPSPHSKDSRNGLAGVTAGHTSICSLDRILRYRGYAITDLLECSFEEVAYLLLWGDLPTKNQLREFAMRLYTHAQSLPETVLWCFERLAKTSPQCSIMDVLRTGVSILGQLECDNGPEEMPHNRDLSQERLKAEQLLGHVPALLASWIDCISGRRPTPWPKKPLATALLEKLCHTQISKNAASVFTKTLILYAEHEFNASTFAARTVTSTGSDMHSAITTAIGALKGPLHGGANEKVLEQLMDIGTPENVEPWVARQLENKDVIMGFGHRIYKSGDIRAILLREAGHQLDDSSPSFEPYRKLEKLAHKVESVLLEQKRLKPNLDWPAARIYHALGLPINLFTPLFVVARMSGWTSHIIEQMSDNRLIRPVAKYIGPSPRQYLALEDR
ncbi:MAG: citrate synthase [Planctomycetaceae bacterium]|nr:citrate synthase [Planctomycetaceae bacterium]